VTRPDKWAGLRSLFGGRPSVQAADPRATPPEPAADEPSLATPNDDAPPAPAAPLDANSFQRGELTPGLLAVETACATNLLYERLSPEDVAEVEQLIRDTPGAWEHYGSTPNGPARRQVLLAFGAWLGATVPFQKIGLPIVQPPEDVHAMARDALSAAGGLYDADMILDALTSAGVAMQDVHQALDFGCSSGRVVRVLAAATPNVQWHGCDPNAPAIAWATENLPGIDFFVNGDAPPLPLPDGSLDLICAISIWSHFAPTLGLQWFEEMHRLLGPGGHLVCTTHGLTAVAHYATLDLRTPEQSQQIREALYRDGSWYAAEFGEEGDWGVVNPDWGTAFLTPEWMLTHLCPRWRVMEFAPGRNQGNQDVYVLQRV
jgi:SAM-dependent methyltransferase